MHRLCSLLLRYPDADIDEAVAESADAELAAAPAEATPFLRAFLEWQCETSLADRARAYVDAFDFRSATSLYLTFHRLGDRRDRGRALVALKRAYAQAGWEPAAGELPDYLPLLLELAAEEPALGEDVLVSFGAELERILHALEEAGAPYALLLAALTATLPPPDPAAVEALLAEGPPTELVGIGESAC